MIHAPLAIEVLRWAVRRESDALREPALTAADDLLYLERLEIDSLFYLAQDAGSPRQQLYDRVWNEQLAALTKVLQAFDHAKIPVLVLKGGELIPAGFGRHGMGLVSDVDLLVRRQDIGRARVILFGLGLRQAVYDQQRGELVDRDIADIADIEGRHYELAPFCRLDQITLPREAYTLLQARNRPPVYVAGDRTLLLTEIDLHHGIATDVESEPFFERAVPSVHGIGSTMSAADHLWFVITRMYNEIALHGKQTLRGFAYTLPLLARRDLDWNVVAQVADELSLGPTLYYHLYFMNWIAQSVPAELLERLHPSANPRVRDWGWQLAKLFGQVDPFPFALK